MIDLNDPPETPDWHPDLPRPVAWLDDYRRRVDDESHIVRGTE